MRSPNGERKKKPGPRIREGGEDGGTSSPRRHRPRRPSTDGYDEDQEERRRRHRHHRHREEGGNHEDRRSSRHRRTVGGEVGADDDGGEHRKRRPRRPSENGRHRGRSRSQSQRKHRSGEDGRSLSVSQRDGRKVRKPRPPPKDMDEEERRRRMRKKKQREKMMNGSVDSFDGSIDDLNDEELRKQRRMRKKKSRENMDSSVDGTISISTDDGDFEKELTSPMTGKTRRVKKSGGDVISNMSDLGGNGRSPETPNRMRKKKLSRRDEGMRASMNDIPNSAANFDVEAFMKRQKSMRSLGEGSTNSNPTGFDVADFVKRQKASRSGSNNSLATPNSAQQQQQRAEEAKKLASLESQIESLNKQLEQQELELAASINEIAAHEETKKELEDARERLNEFEAARGSSSMDFLTDQLEDQRQKLDKALRAAAAGEEAKKELEEIQSQFNLVIDEKDELLKALDSAEQEMGTKDSRIMSLEKAVESQLDTIERLEDKLETTEDELFQMEEELKSLQKKGVLDESSHSIQRGTRIDNLRSDRAQRRDSIKMEISNSQHLLSSSSHHARSLASDDEDGDERVNKELSKKQNDLDWQNREAELDSFERELAEREQKLNTDRQKDELRESRLEEWEQDLMEKESTLKKASSATGDAQDSEELNELLKDLEEKDQMLKETRDALESDKAELLLARREANHLQQLLDDGARNGHSQNPYVELGTDFEEKEKQILSLKETCQRLEDEKIEIIRNQEELDIQRDEELRRIQQDIHQKLQGLDVANQDLRRQLQESEQKAMKVSGLQKVINLLEDEVRSLRKVEGGEEGDAMEQHRDAIARQLADLDEDNQNLSEEVAKQKREFEEALDEKIETIQELEKMLYDSQRKLQTASSGGGAFTASLLKEVSELKQKLKAEENGEGGAGQLAKQLKEKDNLINDLNEAMMKLKMEQDDNAAAGQEERVIELEEQLAAMKADFASRASKDTLAKLRAEIKSLKDTVKELRQELKTEKQEAESRMKTKDESIAFFQAQMMKLTQDLARVKKNEQKRPGFLSSMGGASAELKQQVTELEEEITMLKASNMQLEDEIAVLKAERIELKNKLTLSKLDNAAAVDDDDGSLGSAIQSPMASPMGSPAGRFRPTVDRSHDFQTSISSLGSPMNMANPHTSGHSSISSSAGFDANGASQRAMRTIGGLWNAVRIQQPPAAPGGLYSNRENDD